MKKSRRIALLVGLALPLIITPILLITTPDICSTGPLEHIRGFNAYFDSHGATASPNNGWLIDYIVIGALSSIFILYYCDWFQNIKSPLKSTFLFLGVLSSIAILSFITVIIVNFHCWTF
jgi:hypothetical protein